MIKKKTLHSSNNSPDEINKKYSSYLEGIYNKFSGELMAIQEFAPHEILGMLANAWNMGNMKTIMPPEYLHMMMSDFPYENIIEIIEKVVDYKFENFKSDDLFMYEFDLEISNGNVTIEVAVMDQSAFFDKLEEEALEGIDVMLDDGQNEVGYVSRAAFIIKRKTAFYDWLTQFIPPSSIDDDLGSDSTVYLLDYDLFYGEPDVWLKQNYRLILEQEISKMLTPKEELIERQSLTQFKKWCSISFVGEVFDTMPEPLLKNE